MKVINGKRVCENVQERLTEAVKLKSKNPSRYKIQLERLSNGKMCLKVTDNDAQVTRMFCD